MVLLPSAAGVQKFKRYNFTLQISPLITTKNSIRKKHEIIHAIDGARFFAQWTNHPAS
jgi:hypothetical protein